MRPAALFFIGVGGVVGVGMVGASPAFAFDCEPEKDAATLRFAVSYPVNTHLWIEVTGSPPNSWQLVPATGKPIALAARAMRDGRVYELIPKRALSPNTAYRVRSAAGTHALEAGSFTTSDMVDTTAPDGNALERVLPIDYAEQSDAGGRQGYSLEMTGAARDELGTVYYAVWAAPKKIDYSKPAQTVVTVDKNGSYAVDTGAVCQPSNFPFLSGGGPTDSGDKPAPFVVGVRALDAAGNLGPPAERKVDFRHHAISELRQRELLCELAAGSETTHPVARPAGSAATDTHVWIFLHASSVTLADAKPPKFWLLDVDKRAKVEMSQKRAFGLAAVELVPAQPLRANARYRIFDHDTQIGELTARAATPTVAPAKPSLSFAHDRELGVNVSAPGLYLMRIDGDGIQTGWVLREAVGGKIVTHPEQTCEIGDLDDNAKLLRSKQLTFTVKAIDPAGRESELAEIAVDESSYR